MGNAWAKRLCVLGVSASLVIAGCSAESSKKEVVANPLRDPNLVVAEYAARAIEAAGGADAWAITGWIRADCVVAFHEPELYLTKHHYDVRAWPEYVSINASEPEGKFTWTLSAEGFRVSEGGVGVDSARVRMVDEGFAASLLQIMTAPVRLTVESGRLKRGASAVKLEGRWYYAIESVGGGGVVFYQQRESRLIEAVCLRGAGGKGWLTVKGYDYAGARRTGVVVPRTVEIFAGRAAERLGQRLVKIDLAKVLAERAGEPQ
jgi:hypothetical protein